MEAAVGAERGRGGVEGFEDEWLSAAEEYARQALEACTGCGICLAACVSARALGPRYSPPERIRAAASVLLSHGEAGERELELLYTCSICGACTAACPAGIEVWRLVHAARLAAARKGRQPPSIARIAENAARGGHSFTPSPEKPRRVLREAAARAGVEPGAPGEALYVPSPFETTLYPDVLEASLRLLRGSGVEATVSENVLDLGGNAAVDAARPSVGLALLERAVEEAERLGARLIVLSGCGADHKLAALAREAGLRTRVEFTSLYELVEPGPCRGCVLFPSCSIARFYTKPAPRVKRAAERGTRDRPPYTRCCGGGGGLTYIREQPLRGLRDQILATRARELAREAGDKTLVTPCIKCSTAIRQGALLAKQSLRVKHLASALAETRRQRS